MKYKILVLVTLLMFQGQSYAVGAGREVTIVKVHPVSKSRSDTSGKAITRVYVNSASWGETTCRADAADLDGDDLHIMSVFLAAWMAGKSITINVDDTLRPLDTVCKVTSLTVQ